MWLTIHLRLDPALHRLVAKPLKEGLEEGVQRVLPLYGTAASILTPVVRVSFDVSRRLPACEMRPPIQYMTGPRQLVLMQCVCYMARFQKNIEMHL